MAESALRLTPSMSQADLDPLWAREDIHTYPSGLSRAAARAIHTYPSRDVPRRLMYVEKVQNAADEHAGAMYMTIVRPGLFFQREGPGSEPGNSLLCPTRPHAVRAVS